ncbi:MAG: 4Fe-4S cluster-binding domain-containing protein [Kiritimatiellae bacterium]|nr:4Fe-4S cluster-binding domain-containing protein [Kiritimatiellia bacterium]
MTDKSVSIHENCSVGTRRSRYANREARIRLTPKCNYSCFFCHEEGGCQAPAAEWGSLSPLLLALKGQGRREITFTGGEPLLNKAVLLKAIEEIASWDVQPVVTMITNATLMDMSVIEALERSCALGCEHCEATRGDSFTGGTHYHPCFLSPMAIPMAGRSLEDVLTEGEDYIKRFIAGRTAA